jgi:5-formyltetrahydrofolate cyclo-ligase
MAAPALRHFMHVPSKDDLRRSMRALLRAMDPAVRLSDSRRLVDRLAGLPAWQCATRVLLYWPMPTEPDVRDLLGAAAEADRWVCLPAWDPATGTYVARRVAGTDELVAGKFGISEPASSCPVVAVAALDFALVPGLAFDRRGGRLGRGAGFYDRLLASFRGVACGVGFDGQIVPEVPVESHDVKLNLVLTPSQLHTCGASG